MNNDDLITQFMGYTYSRRYIQWYDRDNHPLGEYLHFSRDWNALMSVVDRIASVYNVEFVDDEDGYQLQAWNEMRSYKRQSYNLVFQSEPKPRGVGRLWATYHAVVEFIKWYNSKDAVPSS